MTKQDKQPTTAESDASSPETLGDRLPYRAALRKNRVLDLSYRVVVGLVGSLIIVVGIILLPLPGPGWLIIFAGLFVLSTEFEWADRLLDFARAKVQAWTDWVKRQSIVIRALIALGCLLLVAAAVWAYIAWKGIPEWIPYVG